MVNKLIVVDSAFDCCGVLPCAKSHTIRRDIFFNINGHVNMMVGKATRRSDIGDLIDCIATGVHRL